MPNRTVLFVCQHGAGKSRMAAAWFNQAPPAGWAAAAGVQPQSRVSVHAPRLLAGTLAKGGARPRTAAAAVSGARPGDPGGAVMAADPGTSRWWVLLAYRMPRDILRHYDLTDPVLWRVAEIVHEDDRFDAPEAPAWTPSSAACPCPARTTAPWRSPA